MIVVLSGEGPTDLGQCNNAQSICEGDDFQIGPMTVLLDQMLKSRLKDSQRSIRGGYHYVSETGLKSEEHARKKNSRKVSFVGKKRDQETGYFYINAWMLGEIALQMENEHKSPVLAVLFRDCDGTRSTRSGLWQNKWKSMENGFRRAQFSTGVPMLPNPKSEAWLLCAAKLSLKNCAALEDISGNDNSPNSAKLQLDGALGAQKTREELCEWLGENPIDEKRASSMPSFKAFIDELDRALNQIIH